MSGLVIDDGIKESDYGYVLRVSGPRECALVANLREAKGAAWLLPARCEGSALGSLPVFAIGGGVEVAGVVDDLLQTVCPRARERERSTRKGSRIMFCGKKETRRCDAAAVSSCFVFAEG